MKFSGFNAYLIFLAITGSLLSSHRELLEKQVHQEKLDPQEPESVMVSAIRAI